MNVYEGQYLSCLIAAGLPTETLVTLLGDVGYSSTGIVKVVQDRVQDMGTDSGDLVKLVSELKNHPSDCNCVSCRT